MLPVDTQVTVGCHESLSPRIGRAGPPSADRHTFVVFYRRWSTHSSGALERRLAAERVVQNRRELDRTASWRVDTSDGTCASYCVSDAGTSRIKCAYCAIRVDKRHRIIDIPNALAPLSTVDFAWS